MRLIISEKANTAKKIAQFLSEGPVKEGKHRSVPHHTFTWKGEETVSVGLKGHVLNPEYPEEYSNWQKVEPRELIDAEILKSVSEKGVAQAVTSLSKKADRVVIATDFDREGELIGVEALSLVFEANPKLMDHVERARFSALTPGEVGRAFDELMEVSNDLADAGEARQDIDLIWGATLTRWVSRATKRYGSAFLTAAANIGISPSRAARIAEDLYTDGYISYPRTDNTVYPRSLDLREVLGYLGGVEGVGQHAEGLLSQGELSPTRGKKETTDHPPIYPTGYASKESMRDDRWKIYQLVVRRFLATLSGPAKTLRTTLRFDSGGEPLTTSGTVVTEEGWLGVYFYGRRADEELPRLDEGEEVEVVEAEVIGKETQPPGRYGQGRLITVMEDLGLGTKATRPNIIQNLYDRGYVHDDPLIPTEKGIALARALKDFASEIASHEMTSELETSMDAISEGKTSKENVVDESRDVLRRVYENLTESEQEFADIVWNGIRGDETLGKCPESGHNLIIRRNRKSGKRFVGCEGYPECRVTYPLPQKGTIIPMGTQCDACNSPEIKVLGGKRPWVTCINMDCPKKQEQREAKDEGGEPSSRESAQELE